MKKININIFIALSILAMLYLCIWLFNHINAWIGIFGIIITAVVTGNYLFKLFKDKENEKKS